MNDYQAKKLREDWAGVLAVIALGLLTAAIWIGPGELHLKLVAQAIVIGALAFLVRP